MKAIVSSDLLKSDLNKILSIVDKKSIRPILSYGLLEAKENAIEVTASNLEVSAKLVINANVEKSGAFCANIKNISDIVKELPSGELLLDASTQNCLNINRTNIHYSLLVYNYDDFPHLTFSDQQNEIIIKSNDLLKLISKTSHAVSFDETRLYLNGIFFQKIGKRIRAVATDGHRLSLFETDPHEGLIDIDPLSSGIIIPKKGINELKKMAESFPHEDLKVSFDESFMYVNAGNRYFLSIHLMAREYPKYQAVIPNKTSYTLLADKRILYNALKRIKIMSNEKSNGVKVKLRNSNIMISANHPAFGEANEEIPVEYNGKEMEIGFNALYLLDSLATFNDGQIHMEINNELSPVVLKSENSPNYMNIIMPLKL
jgi:DNA polymerase-3 subunit beta